eukprot:SAG31_NODE_21922_length_538_cov_0.446469_1_plen_105_part_01
MPKYPVPPDDGGHYLGQQLLPLGAGQARRQPQHIQNKPPLRATPRGKAIGAASGLACAVAATAAAAAAVCMWHLQHLKYDPQSFANYTTVNDAWRATAAAPPPTD